MRFVKTKSTRLHLHYNLILTIISIALQTKQPKNYIGKKGRVVNQRATVSRLLNDFNEIF